MKRWEFMAACTSHEAHAVYRTAELHTAMVVGLHINDTKPGAFPYPSVATLARKTGYDRSTVIRHLNALCSGPWPLLCRHITPGKATRYQPVASRTPATSGTSATSRTSEQASRTGPSTSRTSTPNPSHQRDTNSVEQSRELSREPPPQGGGEHSHTKPTDRIPEVSAEAVRVARARKQIHPDRYVYRQNYRLEAGRMLKAWPEAKPLPPTPELVEMVVARVESEAAKLRTACNGERATA